MPPAPGPLPCTLPPLLFASPAVSGQEPICRVYNDYGEVVTLPHCMDNVMQCRTDPYLKAIGKNCIGEPWLSAALIIRCVVRVLLSARCTSLPCVELSDASAPPVLLGLLGPSPSSCKRRLMPSACAPLQLPTLALSPQCRPTSTRTTMAAWAP